MKVLSCLLIGSVLSAWWAYLPSAVPVSEEHQNTLALSWGLQVYHSQDLIFSEQIYRGGSLLTVNLFYQRTQRHGIHRVRLGVTRVNVRASGPFPYLVGGEPQRTSPSSASYVYLQYGYARHIVKGGNFALRLGGRVDNSFDFVEYRFGPDENDGSVTSYSLGLWLNGFFRLSAKKKLSFETSFALLAWVGRSTFAVSDEERLQAASEFLHVLTNGQFEFLSDFTRLNFSITYVESVFSNSDLLLTYRFAYLNHNDPVEISVLRNSFEVGLAFHF